MRQHKRRIIRMLVLALIILCVPLLHIAFDEENETLDNAKRDALGIQYLALEQGSVHYQLEGEATGDLVVLVHGFSIPSYIWDETAAILVEQGYRVLRMDLYGRGFSDRPQLPYTIDLFTEQLSSLLARLELEMSFHLIGLSMGGPISTRFAHQNAQQIKSLTLLSPLVETPDSAQLKLLAVPYLGEYLATTVMIPKLKNGLANNVYDPSVYPQWHQKLDQHIHYRGYRAALLSTARYLAGKSFEEDYQQLGNSGIPAQLIWGREDRIVPIEQSEKIIKYVKNTNMISLEQTGHLPHIEQTVRVHTAILEFLSRYSDI